MSDLQANIASFREGDVVEVTYNYEGHTATLTGAVTHLKFPNNLYIGPVFIGRADGSFVGTHITAVRVIERASLPLPTEPGSVIDVEWTDGRRGRYVRTTNFWSPGNCDPEFVAANARVLKVHNLGPIGGSDAE